MGTRFTAWLVDLILWLIIGCAVGVAVDTAVGESPANAAFFVLTGAYYWLVPALTGRTLGKLVCGIRVVQAKDLDRAPGIGWMLLRQTTFLVLMFFPLGLIMDAVIGTNDKPRTRTIHDLAGNTVVVHPTRLNYWRAHTTVPPESAHLVYPGQPAPPQPLVTPTLIVLLCTLGGLIAAGMLVSAIAAVKDSNYHKTMHADATAGAAAEDAYYQSTGGYWSGTIIAGASAQVGGLTVTPSAGNSMTFTVLAEGGYCVRVDDTDSPTHEPHYYSSLTRVVTHDGCAGTPISQPPTNPTPQPPIPAPTNTNEPNPGYEPEPVGSCWTAATTKPGKARQVTDLVPCSSPRAVYVATIQVTKPSQCPPSTEHYVDNGTTGTPPHKTYLCLARTPKAT